MADENDPRIERVARALCQVDGKDPDGEHPTGKQESVRAGNAFHLVNKSIPNWRVYETEAKKFVAAFDALHTPPELLKGDGEGEAMPGLA
jgi:hypothetical protein